MPYSESPFEWKGNNFLEGYRRYSYLHLFHWLHSEWLLYTYLSDQ